MPRIITGTVPVQISKYIELEELNDADDKKLFVRLNFTDTDMADRGWSIVGTAQVTVTLNDADTIVGDKVKSLQTEATKVQADAQAAVTRIQRQINELLAITNEVAQ